MGREIKTQRREGRSMNSACLVLVSDALVLGGCTLICASYDTSSFKAVNVTLSREKQMARRSRSSSDRIANLGSTWATQNSVPTK